MPQLELPADHLLVAAHIAAVMGPLCFSSAVREAKGPWRKEHWASTGKKVHLILLSVPMRSESVIPIKDTAYGHQGAAHHRLEGKTQPHRSPRRRNRRRAD